ncbi:DUF2125 domain-containing protein [Paracoccaceae bacterium Fryx2]|nr:DUF2125 domain-containing protein [Paracoccaceae bacterium Fryx2]
MRGLLTFVLIAALAWGGYWFVGARGLEQAANKWFDAAPAQGLVAERESLVVRGFPSRFDLTVTGLRLEDRARGLGWQAPFVQVFSLSYKPWHLIVALPPEQTFTLPGQTVTLTSESLKGSLILTPNADLGLDRIAITTDSPAASSTLGWAHAARSARLATRVVQDRPDTHDIALEILGLAPDPALMADLPGLPAVIDTLSVQVQASFSAPLDRHAAETRPRLTGLIVDESRVTWGSLGLFAKGEIAADAQGRAEGRIMLRLENWRTAFEAARTLGLLTPEVAPTIEQALTLLAGSSDVLDLPLSFQSGRMSLGPIPLGPAPMLN